ncbi:MAG TPA: PaaI family thioesterase [Bacillota bacterium]|nr:PaaI family thioesterase [Bacillota bacterium]
MLRDDGYCYACGKENPVGLHLTFHYEPDGSVNTVFTPEKTHQGYAEVVHGGILATLADESMAHVLIARGIAAMTARLEVAYKRPARVGEPLKVIARLESEEKRLLRLVCQIFNQEGQTLVETKAVFLRQKAEK